MDKYVQNLMTNTNTEMTGVINIIMISQEGKKKIQGLVKWRGKKKKDEVDDERERTKMLITDCRNQTMESCQ